MSPHRCAAQYGQNSAPTNSTSGLPPLVSGWPPILMGGAWTLPGPTRLAAAGGTLVTWATRACRLELPGLGAFPVASEDAAAEAAAAGEVFPRVTL